MSHAQCACGALRFSSSSPAILQLVCHCAQCRQVSGQPYTRFSFFKVRDTTVEGAVRTVEFVSDAGHRTVRECCAACGQMVIDRTEGYPKIVGVVHDTLQPAEPFQPAHQVWTAARAPGVEPLPGVPAYAAGFA